MQEVISGDEFVALLVVVGPVDEVTLVKADCEVDPADFDVIVLFEETERVPVSVEFPDVLERLFEVGGRLPMTVVFPV